MSLIEAIRAALIDAGIAPVYMASIPAEVDTAVSIQGPYMNTVIDESFTGLLIQRFQCYVRDDTHNDAEALSRRCFNALADKYLQADIEVGEIIPLQGPTFLGTDANGRYEFVFNFEMACWLV